MSDEFNANDLSDDIEPVVARTSGGRVVLLGTAHGLQRIIDFVDGFIRTEQPDLVLVELEHLAFSVWNLLVDKSVDSTTDLDVATFLEWRSKIELDVREKRFQLPKGEMIQAIQTSKDLAIPWEIIDMPLEEIARIAGARETKLEGLANDSIQNANIDFLGTYIATAVRFAQLAGLINTKKSEDPAINERVLAAREEYMAQKINAWVTESTYQKILVVCGGAHITPLLTLVNRD
jgi:pheromone shutdown protein TraB